MTIRILLVDDDQDQLFILELMLRKKGFNVRSVRDSATAVAAAKEFQPDIVVSDVCMPNLDGISLTSKLRSLEQFKHIPIVLLTAGERDEKGAAGAGATAIYAKTGPYGGLAALLASFNAAESSEVMC